MRDLNFHADANVRDKYHKCFSLNLTDIQNTYNDKDKGINGDN